MWKIVAGHHLLNLTINSLVVQKILANSFGIIINASKFSVHRNESNMVTHVGVKRDYKMLHVDMHSNNKNAYNEYNIFPRASSRSHSFASFP
jgi:hypothetical protein